MSSADRDALRVSSGKRPDKRRRHDDDEPDPRDKRARRRREREAHRLQDDLRDRREREERQRRKIAAERGNRHHLHARLDGLRAADKAVWDEDDDWDELEG